MSCKTILLILVMTAFIIVRYMHTTYSVPSSNIVIDAKERQAKAVEKMLGK